MGKIGTWFGSWRLVSWRSAIVLAFILYTLFGFFGVPWIAEKVAVNQVAKKLDRELTIENIECNPFALSMTIEGLSLPDRPGSTVLAFDRVYANLQASSLFRWAITLKQLHVDHPYVGIRRFEDKVVNVLELVETLKSTSEPSEEKSSLPRAILQEIQIFAGVMEVEDLAAAEAKAWEWSPIDVSLNDISTLAKKQGDKDITIGLAGDGTLHIAGTLVVEPFGLDGSVSLEGGQLDNLWRAVAEKFQFDLNGGQMDAKIVYSATMQDDGPHLKIRDSSFVVSDLHVAEVASDTEILTVDKVDISGVFGEWPEQRVSADSVVVDGAFAQAWIEPDGTPSWEAWVPAPTRDEVVEAYKFVNERVDFEASLARFELRNAGAAFENRSLPDAAKVEVSEAGVSVTDISTKPDSSWGLAASAALAGESRVSATGTFVAIPISLDAEVGLENLELSQFQAYVAQAAPLDLRAGVLSASGQAHVATTEDGNDVSFAGELAVTGLDLDETVTGGKLLGWGDLKVGGIEAALVPLTVDVATVDIYRAGLEIVVAEDGSINLLEFFTALGQNEPGETSGTEDADAGLPPAHVAKLQLHDCYGRYFDQTTVEPFERRVEAVNGTITKIATDSKAGAELEIDAAVDSGGSIRVAGTIDPFDYKHLTDIDLDVKNTLLPPMSPMSIKILGYPIDTGQATLDGSYTITDYQLASTSHIELDNLTLGEKVEGEGATNLPIKLGISLLKDKNNRITLDVPIEGDLNDPEFVVTSAIAAAATDLVGEIAKSPFRMLARLGGGSDDQNLDLIDFEAGSSTLAPQTTNNLETLAKALADRPNLTLEIEGTIDVETDRSGLQEQAGESQTVDSTEILALGPARAEAIRSYLADEAGVDPSRISVNPETAQVTTGEPRVSCRLTVRTGD